MTLFFYLLKQQPPISINAPTYVLNGDYLTIKKGAGQLYVKRNNGNWMEAGSDYFSEIGGDTFYAKNKIGLMESEVVTIQKSSTIFNSKFDSKFL